MIVLKITTLGFEGSDDHTVGYRRKVTQYLLGAGAMPSTLSFEKDMSSNDNFKMSVGERIEDARENMRAQVAHHLSTISWLNADLNDFYFEAVHSEVKDGLFLFPSGKGTRAYRVSDGKEL